MVMLPPIGDPTLNAVDAEIAAHYRKTWKPRAYLGMSAIGQECERRLWYSFRWVSNEAPDASGVKRIEDGHRGEAVIAGWLQAVPEITLMTQGDNGKQIGVSDHGGHFRGHLDGLLFGLLQAPKTMHVWECKIVGEDKYKSLIKLKSDYGEKAALAKWDPVYYAQAVMYMHYTHTTRHYLTVGTPGARDITSCRTEADEAAAIRLRAKAERVIFANRPGARLSDNPSWYQCKWCPHWAVCHEDEIPPRSCRTCIHSTPLPDGRWSCDTSTSTLTHEQQIKGCEWHKFHPDVINAKQTDAGDGWVEYQRPDGTVFVDGIKPN